MFEIILIKNWLYLCLIPEIYIIVSVLILVPSDGDVPAVAGVHIVDSVPVVGALL
jgi:hypothetical protein